jgi:hypothetical protein
MGISGARQLVATSALVAASAVLAPSASAAPAAFDGVPCANVHALGIDRQMNLRASSVLVGCGLVPGGHGGPPAAPSASLAAPLSLPGSDLNLITGTETWPHVTQSESTVWSNGSTIVVNYNDSNTDIASPPNYSGVSVSHDGGATWTRELPAPFASGHQGNFGDPILVYNAKFGEWFGGDLTGTGSGTGNCGSAGIGLWTSPDGDTWTPGVCAVVENSPGADRESMWVDNDPSSPFYGRMYISWNDFNVGTAPIKVIHSDDGGLTWSSPITLNSTGGFIRQVELTGGPDGTVFEAGLFENGGGLPKTGLQNYMFKSTDGGATWTSVAASAIPGTFSMPGDSLCAGSTYFPKISPLWRETGYGIPAVGPNGVVMYDYAAHGAGSDPSDVFLVRSTDNGATWSSPVKLNTDSTTTPQWMPSLRITQNGIVEATWYDERDSSGGTTYERFARISSDDGATWGPDQPLSTVQITQPTQPDTGVQACYAGDYNYTTATSNTGFDTWTDGRVAIPSHTNQQDVFFHAIPLQLPTATAGAPGAITSSSAVLNGTVNPGGQNTTWVVQYGPTPSLGSATTAQSAGSGASDVPVQATASGLPAGSALYYKFVANNDSGGSGSSSTQTLSTKPNPTATAGKPGKLGLHTAVVNGSVNPGGEATTWVVQYGTSPSLGSQTSSQSAGSGTSDSAVKTTLSGLPSGKTIYYQFVVTNDSGGSGQSSLAHLNTPWFVLGHIKLKGSAIVIPAKVAAGGKMSCKATFKPNGHKATYGSSKVKVRHAGRATCTIEPASVGLALFVGSHKRIKFSITVTFKGTKLVTKVRL